MNQTPNSYSSEAGIWKRMRYRCNNQRSPDYHLYGARGIRVCDRWASFANFYADMGPRPSPKHTLDRIDNGGDYEPGNCRWATPVEQARNRRGNRALSCCGETLLLTEWAARLGLSVQGLIGRLKRFPSIEEALTRKPRHYPANRRSRTFLESK